MGPKKYRATLLGGLSINNVPNERQARGCQNKSGRILRKSSSRLGLNFDSYLSTELRDLAKCTKMANEEIAGAAAAAVGGEAESALSRNSVTAAAGASTTASPAPAISDAVKKRMRFVVSSSVQKGQHELY